MKKNNSIISIVSCLIIICNNSKANDNIVKTTDFEKKCWSLVQQCILESEVNYKATNPKSIYEWQKIFEQQYHLVLQYKNPALQFKVGFLLASIYHNLTYFEKELPLLEYLYKHKDKLELKEYKSLLIKLEEVYRSKNNLYNALKIRKERIAKQFIQTYWELYRDCGLFEAAKKDYVSFEPLPLSHNDDRLHYYAFLSGLLIEMNEIDSAKNVLFTGIKEANQFIEENKKNNQFRQEDLLYWKGNMIGQLAQCDLIQHKYEGSLPKLKYNLSTTGSNTDNKIEVFILLAETYLHNKDFDSAKKSLDSAWILLRGKTMKNAQKNFLRVKASYFKSTKNLDSAYYYLNSYTQYKDSLQLNIQKNQSVLVLAEFEIASRRNELLVSKNNLELIAKHNKKQANQLIWLAISLAFSLLFGGALIANIRTKNRNKKQILSQNEQLKNNALNIEKQNKHNQVLLKELHHRVKNNLQVIYSLLNIQKRRNTDQELKETISSVQTRIQTMSLVHQNLYQSNNFENVDVNYYIRNLVTHLQNLYKIDEQKVVIEFDIQTSLELNIEKIIPLGLMINEAVSNAFKYAFNNREKGKLQVNIEQLNNCLYVEVIDDGPGFNKESTKEASIGLQLIQIMCKQLNANYQIDTLSGVIHKIEFKI